MRAKTNEYWFSQNGLICYGIVSTGEIFLIDSEDIEKVRDIPWYRCNGGINGKYIGNQKGICIHRYILRAPDGFEIDHINQNPLDNRKQNLRLCTHQQNQCNQGLQKNNSSGVAGVSYYSPRGKYRARIKYFQKEAHLGYYETFAEAVQARNEGMKCLFGEFGVYNDVPEASPDTKKYVKEKCDRLLAESVVFYGGSE